MKKVIVGSMIIFQYNPKHKILVLNSWNEWTEGSYLLPEKRYGDAYLKAIKSVFGN